MADDIDPAILAALAKADSKPLQAEQVDPAILAALAQNPESPGKAESLLRGGAQGLTLGFGDEINGAIQALGERFLPESLGGGGEAAKRAGLLNLYRQNRDAFRQEDKAAEDAHGGWYLGGNVGGGLLGGVLLPSFSGAKAAATLGKLGLGAKAAGVLGRVGAASGTGVLQGGLYGAGGSNAEDTSGLARDIGRGAAIGGALGAGASALGEGAQSLSGAFGRRAESVAQRAKDIAEKQEGKVTSAATGSAGATTQQANRLVENLQRLRAGGNLTPEQVQALDALQGHVAEIEQQLGDSSIRALPDAAARKATADALASEAVASHPERVAKAAEDALAPKTAGKQLLAIAKRYGPVAIGALAGHFIPGIGALHGGAWGRLVSPSLHAIARRAQDPSVQMLLAKSGQGLASGASRLLGAAARNQAAIEAPLELGLIPGLSTSSQMDPAILQQLAQADALARREKQ